jgi:hypothetical protein
MIPPTILSTGAPGETVPIPAFVAYAASGASPVLDGALQAAPAAVTSTSVDGTHILSVGSRSFVTIPPPAAAVNISTRLSVGTAANVLIGGFIIQGPTPKRLVVRAVGPSLAASGIAGVLQNPALELYDVTGSIIAQNDNWRTTQIGGIVNSNQSVDIQASTLAPNNDAESALSVELPPGAYTAIVSGVGETTGVALVEIYDQDASLASKLANISTRGFIQTGDNVMIGGFIFAGGAAATNVVVRAIGPSLAGQGITNPLSDTTLELVNINGDIVAENDDWRQTQEAALQATNLQPGNNAESAILLTSLPRGLYTAIVRGKAGATGVGVVEAYVLQ